MITETRTAPDVERTPPGGASKYQRLRAELGALQRTTARLTGDADTGADHEAIRAFMDPWLPSAEARLRDAGGSPSNRARWREIIAAARRPETDGETGPDTVALGIAARHLLRALMEAERSGPSVPEIADRVRQSIASGEYAPGSLLSAGRIAADTGCSAASVQRAELALRDLQAEDLVTVSSSNRIRVAGSKEVVDRAVQIAAWLRLLIQAGVYPPASPLPARTLLSRALVSAPPDVTSALRQLDKEKVLVCLRGTRPVVRPEPPFLVASPPEMASLLSRLGVAALPDTDLSHTGIREICHRAHSWWHSRITPHPETLHHTVRALTAAAEYLIPLAVRRYPDDPEVHATLRRAAVTALAVCSPDSDSQIWRAACLGAAVLEILNLAGDAA
ncbi:GntR family transcriptional regulator [Streptomyces cyaneofuscatus]|uniref:GntR family transcriptional regulator n=1 Tax=Streptomyces cyaneofuscatus TaxID=66883 RepID=UPI00340D4BED